MDDKVSGTIGIILTMVILAPIFPLIIPLGVIAFLIMIFDNDTRY